MKKSLICLLIACSIISTGSSLVASANTKPSTTTSSSIQLDEKETAPIPKLARFDQVSPNQLEISYDRDVDVKLATSPSNYWVQSLSDVKPKGIATLGKNDKVNDKNSLNASNVKIEPQSGSSKTFILTFSQNIEKGSQYKLIICYVTVPEATPYKGDNGSISFVGK